MKSLDELQHEFLDHLQKKYGHWDKMTSTFGSSSFGAIANDLCISPSQFTKLLYGTATEGMYVRSIENVNRIIRLEQALAEAAQDREAKELAEKQLQRFRKRAKYARARGIALSMLGLTILGITAFFLVWRNQMRVERGLHMVSNHPLSAFFDRGFDSDFDSPYLKQEDVQEYCPCSAYEGVWSLSKPYKLPLPGNKQPGVYYLAKSADVRMKCSKSDTLPAGKGRVLLAYEYLVNEIWVDKERALLSPRYFDKETKTFTREFEQLSFEENPRFEKAATIHSFFINKLELYRDSIVRKGEPCGRYATDVNESLIREYTLDLKHILEDVLGDLTRTNCAPSSNAFCDPNDLEEGKSVVSFDCYYTIKAENLGFGGGYPYKKGYLLNKQSYSDNLTCECAW